jgi:SAM-dependent methyltransferase
VKPEIAARLIEINRQFYQNFAAEFSATRARVNPGVARVLDEIPLDANILDLGCGNGSVALALKQHGLNGHYLGLDFSPELLEVARQELADSLNFQFILADLAADWSSQLPSGGFDPILSFAAFHHIPSRDARRAFLEQARTCLAPGGRFIHSHWQFLNSPSLAERVQDWSLVGLDPADLDPNDYLLDWRAGGQALRYVHLATDQELAQLAQNSGFIIRDTFSSDGSTGDLGLYQIWQKAS